MTQQTFQINERIIEALLSMPPKNIGELLWVSGNVIRMAFAISAVSNLVGRVSEQLKYQIPKT